MKPMQKLVKIDEDMLDELKKLAKADSRSLANMLRVLIIKARKGKR